MILNPKRQSWWRFPIFPAARIWRAKTLGAVEYFVKSNIDMAHLAESIKNIYNLI